MNAITAASLADKSLATLTAIYNGLVDKPIKKFSCSTAKAIEKILAVAPKVVTKPAKAKGATGIGEMIKACLKGGMTPADTLATIKANVPECATTIACVYWYASRIKRGID